MVMRWLFLGMLGVVALPAQTTQVDLRWQSKSVDFSAASATKPFKSGNSLPSTCSAGELFYKLDATPGANLYACTSQDLWTPQSGLGQLGAFNVIRTSATTLSIGSDCSAAAPCSARFGNVVYSFLSGASVSISAGTGLAFVYVSSTGALAVGHNVTANCTFGCSSQSGVSAFPADSIPLFTWSATNGAWDLDGGLDQRAALSSKPVVPGTGLTAIEITGKTVLSADSSVVSLRTSVPASSISTCIAGAWAMDSFYYYLCVGTNVWRRTALSSW